MKTRIIVNIIVPGLHRWEAAKDTLPEVGFLSASHFHKFEIRATKEVKTGDNERPIEIIMYSRELEDYFKRNYWNEEAKCVDFGNMSCESIAKDLMEAYDLDYCSVMEDGYWGAEVERL